MLAPPAHTPRKPRRYLFEDNSGCRKTSRPEKGVGESSRDGQMIVEDVVISDLMGAYCNVKDPIAG